MVSVYSSRTHSAVVPPRIAVCRFDVPGETGSIHQRGALHAFAQLTAQGSEVNQIVAERRGGSDDRRIGLGGTLEQVQLL